MSDAFPKLSHVHWWQQQAFDASKTTLPRSQVVVHLQALTLLSAIQSQPILDQVKFRSRPRDVHHHRDCWE